MQLVKFIMWLTLALPQHHYHHHQVWIPKSKQLLYDHRPTYLYFLIFDRTAFLNKQYIIILSVASLLTYDGFLELCRQCLICSSTTLLSRTTILLSVTLKTLNRFLFFSAIFVASALFLLASAEVVLLDTTCKCPCPNHYEDE